MGPVLICSITGNFEAGNSLNLPDGGRRSTFAGNSALLPPDVLDFTVLPAQKFWWEWETASLLDVM